MGGYGRVIGLVAWVWVIIIGGIIIIIWPPHPGPCIVCGGNWDMTLGVISVVLGALAIVTNYMAGER